MLSHLEHRDFVFGVEITSSLIPYLYLDIDNDYLPSDVVDDCISVLPDKRILL